jgi:hypothetical protein
MDASLYFRLTDRIDGAGSLEELAAIEAEIDHTAAHDGTPGARAPDESQGASPFGASM